MNLQSETQLSDSVASQVKPTDNEAFPFLARSQNNFREGLRQMQRGSVEQRHTERAPDLCSGMTTVQAHRYRTLRSFEAGPGHQPLLAG